MLSDEKIKVLLKLLQADGVSLEEDLRGRHGNNAMKLLPEARKAVVDFIISKDTSVSHYRRARTRKKYFDCNVSIWKMWPDFVAENPNFQTNHSVSRNKGSFREDLSDVLSFRKARVDTCQYCDQTINKINVLSQSLTNPRRRAQLQELKEAHAIHLWESEVRFASMKYDMIVLSKRQ